MKSLLIKTPFVFVKIEIGLYLRLSSLSYLLIFLVLILFVAKII